jgi:hypothetical protein
MALHELPIAKTIEWYTPPHVFEKLDCHFDTDLASPGQHVTPWIPADRFITRAIDGLIIPYDDLGFCWLNGPFNDEEKGKSKRNGLAPWLDKFAAHADGIALVPDRTSAPWWQYYAPRADLLLVVSPKLQMIDANGGPRKDPPNGTTLLAFGERGCAALERAAGYGLGILVKALTQRSPEWLQVRMPSPKKARSPTTQSRAA